MFFNLQMNCNLLYCNGEKFIIIFAACFLKYCFDVLITLLMQLKSIEKSNRKVFISKSKH